MTPERDDAARDPDEDAEEPVDPDIALTVDYLAGELSPDEAARVEDRFIEDEAFARKVYPLMKMWTAPIDFRAAYEAAAAKERAQAAPEASSEVPYPGIEARRHRVLEGGGEPGSRYHAAPVAPVAPVAPGTAPLQPLTAAEERSLHEDEKYFHRLANLNERVKSMFYIAASLIVVGSLGSGAMYIYQNVASHRNLERTVGEATPRIPLMARGQGVDGPPGGTKTTILTNGSRVVTRPGAHLDIRNPLMGAPIGPSIDLIGEAAFDISTAEGPVMVTTSAGRVFLMPGTYAVRCEPGCAAMLVTVGVGLANLRNDSLKTAVKVNLRDGQHGRVRRGQEPEKVDANAADGYPVLEVTARPGASPGGDTAAAKARRAPSQMPAPAGGRAKAPVESVPRSVQIGRSSLVHLRIGSKFAYKSNLLDLEQTVGLNGEAVIEVGLLDPSVAVSTPAGVVELSHGTYAFHCSGDPNPETLVTVGRGEATLKGGRGKPDLVLKAGEFGRLAYPAAPERTNGGDGYPALDLTKTKP
jgi:hypothetical protein